MTTKRRDPLLTIARLVLTFLMGVAAFFGGVVLAAIPVLVFAKDKVLVEMANEGLHMASQPLLLAIAGLLALLAVIAALCFFFVRHLRLIVDSVAAGDPFIPINAVRLRMMAWLTLAIQLVSLPLGALALWIGTHVKGDVDVDGGISMGGLLLMLTLFILARVFRQGAAMRDDLEGTV